MTTTIVWKRYGNWAAHAYDGDAKLCNFRHNHFERKGAAAKPLIAAALTMSGLPYGHVCSVCAKRVRVRMKEAS